MSVPPPIDSEKLLEQTAWIRALARSLVADPHLAEDLAQDTCVAALERPPADSRNLRGWLAAVLRNLHLQSVRTQTRRLEREERAARGDAQLGALDVLERAALHRELYEAVMALSEPNRTAILLRFFDGLPQRKIASQLGVPVATVHSRVQRGLAELRGRLARPRGGDSRAWVLALLPLAEQASPWRPLNLGNLGTLGPPLGALLMDAKVKVAIGIALVSCGALGIWPLVQRPAEPASEPAVEAAATPARIESERPPTQTLAAESEVPAARVAAGGVPEPEPTLEPAPPAPPTRVRGSVLDPEAAPLAGVKIAFHAGSEGSETEQAAESVKLVATSDARGFFEFELDAPADVGELVAGDPELATLMAGRWRRGSAFEPVVVVAGLRPLAGVVVDEEGKPLAGARVTLRLDPGFESRFAQVLDASKQKVWRTECDANGEFALPRAPAVLGSLLATSHEGHLPDERAAPEYVDSSLEIVLRRPRYDERALEGVVLGPRGETVEGARVVLGGSTASSDRDGRFALELVGGDLANLLRAVKRGYLPAELLASPVSGSDGRGWPAFVTLELGGPTLALAGQVVDEDGRALAGIRVWLADPTYLGLVEEVPTQVENVLAGSPSRAEIEHAEAKDPALRGRDTPSRFWTWVRTDSDGRFRLEGLLERGYRVKAMDTRSLAFVEEGPFTAGSENVRLVLPTRDLSEVTGRVVARSGEPVAGVHVQVVRTTMAVAYGTARSTHAMPGARTLTGEDGRFVLTGAPTHGVFLTFDGDSILPEFRDLEPGDDARSLEVIVTARCHFQVELEEPVGRADRIAVVDDEGQRLQLLMLRGGDEESGPTMPLSAGRSAVLAVGETAAALVLLRGQEEIERHPIALRANALTTLRY